jgi:osmotically-inducible protein OsmY
MSADDTTQAVDISIASSGGVVTLSGIVTDAAEKAAAEAVAATVPGVRAVDNQLRVMSSSGLAFAFAARR